MVAADISKQASSHAARTLPRRPGVASKGAEHARRSPATTTLPRSGNANLGFGRRPRRSSLHLHSGVVGGSDQEVEVGAFVGLQDVALVKQGVAAPGLNGGRQGAIACVPPVPRRRSEDRGVGQARRGGCMSPVRTAASGPPSADSGVTCRTTVPKAVPLMRASEMRTMSFTPCRASFRGIGM